MLNPREFPHIQRLNLKRSLQGVSCYYLTCYALKVRFQDEIESEPAEKNTLTNNLSRHKECAWNLSTTSAKILHDSRDHSPRDEGN